MTVARKYYTRELRKYRKEDAWFFKSPRECEQAIEYVCRCFEVKSPLVIIQKGALEGNIGGRYMPELVLKNFYSPILSLYARYLNLRIVAHELAHHLDVERRIAEHQWLRGLGPLGGKAFRCHTKRHDHIMEIVIQLLKGKYGHRSIFSCAKSKPVVKVRK